MKKAGLIAVSLLLLSLFSAALALAQNEVPGMGEVPGASEIQQGQQKYEQYTTAQNKSEFLKAQWGEILAKNAMLGPVIRAADMVSPVTNPLFKYTIGLEPSLTWLFILTLMLWIAFFFVFYRTLEFSAFSNAVKIIISFGVSSVLAVGGGLFNKIAESMINAISAIGSWWGQLIVALIVLVALIILAVISKKIEKLAKQQKEEIKKAEQEIAMEKITKVGEAITK